MVVFQRITICQKEIGLHVLIVIILRGIVSQAASSKEIEIGKEIGKVRKSFWLDSNVD